MKLKPYIIVLSVHIKKGYDSKSINKIIDFTIFYILRKLYKWKYILKKFFVKKIDKLHLWYSKN